MRRPWLCLAVGGAAALLGGQLAFVGSAAAGPGTAAGAPSRAQHYPADSLRVLAARVGLRIGTAVNPDLLNTNTKYTQITAEQFSSVTPENVMKWYATEPERGRFDFTEAEQLMAFARANGQKVRGHVLVWHSQLPTWLTSGTWSRDELRSIMREHIFAVAGHFRGRIWAWDVVNEAFNDDGTLRDTIWLRTIGPSYIADAFRWAHQADPKAILFYNDYNVEGINAKSNAVYALLRQLKREGVPVEGFGAQGHLATQYGFPRDVLENLRRFGRLGLATAITEADVRIVLPVDNAERWAQAAGYSLMLESCLLERSCISYTVWGFTDRYQWVPGVFPLEGEAAILDADFNPKPAYDAVRRDLALAPHSGHRG